MNKLMNLFPNHIVNSLSHMYVLKPSNLSGSADPTTFDTIMDISPMFDIATVIKLRRLERKAKDILFNWLDYYRFSLGQLWDPLYCCT